MSVLPGATYSAPGNPLYGSGGGGIGPNPSVSTLTFAGPNIPDNTTGTINMTTSLNILDPSVLTPGNYHFQFLTNQNPGDFPGYVQEYQSTLNVFNMWAPFSSVTQTGSFGFSCDILGRSQITAANATGALSTLVISADSVLIPTTATISSLSVSSINGQAPGGSISSFTEASVSSLSVSTLSLQNFDVPTILYGAVNLNAGGSTIVTLDRTYVDPYYQFVTYRGILPASVSTLSVSSLTGDSFQIWGEASQSVQYMVVGN